MGTSVAPIAESAGARLRRGAIWLLFSAVLLIPETLSMRRRPHTWNAMRSALALLGALLIAASLSGHVRAWAVVAGAALLLFAAFVTPERPRLSVDARARELGAVVVVQGGTYRAEDGKPRRNTRLFVGPARLHVLDAQLRVLAEIPVAGLTEVRAMPDGRNWKFEMRWGRPGIPGPQTVAELIFEGPFAEHFARVAESTVHSQIPNPLPILK